MRDFLNDHIDSLPGRTNVKASVLLRQAALERQEISLLIQKATADLTLGNVSFTEVESMKRIRGSEILINFRELLLRMDLFYRLSTDISDLLDSESITIMSEIKELEQEIESIEKSIGNYSFLLSDGNSFDFGFIEPFSDEINRADDIDFTIPDRAGLNFSSNEKAHVNRSSGTLTLSPLVKNTIPYTASITENNYQGFVTSDTGVSNISRTSMDNGWKVSIASSAPISGTLPSFVGQHGLDTYSGAQAIIEMRVDAPAPCDFITLAPLAESCIDIVQIVSYSDESDSDPVELLDQILSIERPVNIFFEPRSISKIKIYIKQKTYRRNNREPLVSERVYRRVFSDYRSRTRYNNKRQFNRVRGISGLSQIFVNNYIRKSRDLAPLSVRTSNKKLGLLRWGPLDSRLDIKRQSGNITARPSWFSKDSSQVIIKASYDTKQMSDQLKRGVFPKRNETTRRANPSYEYLSEGSLNEYSGVRSTYRSGQGNSVYGRIRSISSIENKIATTYRYSLGLNYVTLGIKSQLSKGVFVSKQIPSSGDVIQLKIRDSHTDAKISDDPTLDTKIASSVEYSISNIARPYLEEHWIPIQCSNLNGVTAELLLLDDKGKAFFRFPASKSEGITVYKNNRIFPLETIDLVMSEGDTNTVGVIFDPSLYSPSDVFLVDYVPHGTPDLVDFSRLGYTDTPLISSFDDEGAGEGFLSTGGQLNVKLDNSPFIDYAQVNSSTYDSTLGTTPYQPITIVLSNGSIAINLTNYRNGSQTNLNAGSSSYQFIHRGKTLLFNKEIGSTFRVYYDHLPSNVRVRTVLRSNAQNGLVSPSVDYFQVKAKTRVPNAKEIS
jgi:hypothetical protein